MSFFSRLFRPRTRTLRNTPRTAPKRNRASLQIEVLEDRLAPAVLPVDATHTFVSQLQAANQGDTIEINTGATIGTLGGAGTGSGTAGNTTFTTTTPLVAGQLIDITGEGGNPYLVDATAGGAGPTYTITLHTPLTTTTSGATYTPVANTLGIGKGITIEGNPANPPSALFAGTTLEYFLQLATVTPAPDTLQNLSLTAVSGVTSSDLDILGNTFNITTGSTDAIDVTSGGALDITGDTFTVGGTAALSSVVNGATSAGSITYSNNTISVTGNLAESAVYLTSTSAPITLSSDSLTVSGTVGDDGITINNSRTGEVTASSITVNITGAVTSSGFEIDHAGDVNLSSIGVTLGSTADYGIYASLGGDFVMSGTNSVNITGNVTSAGLYVSGEANATVSNVTVSLGGNAVEGLYVDVDGGISATNTSVTITGNTSYGTELDCDGNLALANSTVLVNGNADYGLYAYGYGIMTVSGTQSVTVKGNVADYGEELDGSYGGLTVSTSIGVSVGGTASTGLYEFSYNNVTNTGAVTVNIGGAVSSYGAELEAYSTLTVSTVNVTLGSSADYGLYLYGYTTAVNGAINVSVTGAVSSYGAYIESYYGDLTIASPITVTLGAATDYGLELYAYEGSVLDTATGATPTISVSVTGNVSSYADYIYANSLVSIAGATSVTVGGTADYGAYIESDEYNVTDTAGINVSITGAVTDDGIYVFATESATLSNIVVNLADVASAEGLEVYVYYGTMNVSNVTVTANKGTTSAYGVDLYSDEYGGSIVAANIIVNMNTDADYGLYAYALAGNISLSSTTVSVTGNASYGIYAESYYGGDITLAGNTTLTIGGTADYGMYIYADESSVVISGPLSATVTGAVADDGIYVYAATNITSTASIAVNLGSTTAYGLELYAGYVTDSGTITVSVASNVTDYGDYIYATSYVSLSGATTVTVGGTADYAAYLESDEGSFTDTAAINVSVTGDVTGAYGAAYIDASGLLSLSAIKVTVGGTADYGAYLYSDEGSFTDTAGITVSITGAVSDDGVYVYADQNITVSNVTVTLADVDSGYGLELYSTYGYITASNLTVTANSGTTSAYGIYIYTEYQGSITAANIIVNMNAAADYGLYAYAEDGGNISLSSTAVSITGNVSEYGIYDEADDGGITLSGNTTVNLGGTASYGMYLDADEGTATISGPLSATVKGAITGTSAAGIYLYAASTIASTASISVNLGSTAAYGLYLDASETNFTDTGTITVNVAGNVADYGAYLYAGNNVKLGGNVSVTLLGTAEDGLVGYADEGAWSNTGTIAVSVTGAVTGGTSTNAGLYLYSSSTGAFSNIAVTLLSTVGTISAEHGYGAYLESAYGNMTVTNLTVNVTGAISGTDASAGVYLYTEYSSLSASGVSVSLASTAEYGIYAYASYGNLTMSATTVSVVGNLSEEGGYFYGSNATVSGLNMNLKGTSAYGFEVEAGYGIATVSGVLFQEAGAITDAGVYLEAEYGNVIASNMNIYLGSTAAEGVEALATYGDVYVSGVNLQAAGLVSDYGLELESQGDLTAFNNSIVLNAGVTDDALYTDAHYESSPGGNTSITYNRIVSQLTTGAAGIDVVGTGPLTLAHNTVFLNGGTGTGALLTGGSGNELTILNNSFDTAGAGTGLSLNSSTSKVVALVQGNFFQYDKIGVKIVGNGTTAGNIDLGGGSLGSLGGNDFHGFTSTAGGVFAISLTGTNNVTTVQAQNNIWSVANPSTVVQDKANGGGTGIINIGTVLTAAQQFVDVTYNQFLGRSASVGEMNIWAGQTQAAVVQGVQFSTEGLNYLLDNLYIEFLNRPADSSASYWLPLLQSGNEEAVIDGLVSSAEFASKNPYTVTSGNSNSGYVQALYSVLLNRSLAAGTLSQAEINGWVADLAGGASRASVAAAFTASSEFRSDIVRSIYGDPTLPVLPFLQVVPNLLHRRAAPLPADVNYWVNSGLLMQALESAFANTAEFYTNG